MGAPIGIPDARSLAAEAPGIRNLVIDLGGVLYAIDPARAATAFQQLRPAGLPALPVAEALAHPMFRAIETGDMSPADFRQTLRSDFQLEATDAELDAAWNALLLQLIPGRVEQIRALCSQYRCILLSNTNLIHQQALAAECKPAFEPLERVFFSYDMGRRKPDPRIYLDALTAMGMSPAESLMIDDSPDNIRGALKAGLKGIVCGPEAFDFEMLTEILTTSSNSVK